MKTQIDKPNNLDTAKLLLEYRNELEARKLELRRQANEIAAKVRMIDKMLDSDTLQAIEDQKAAEQAFTAIPFEQWAAQQQQSGIAHILGKL